MNEQAEPTAGRYGSTTRRMLLAVFVVGGAGSALGGCTVYGGQDEEPAPPSDDDGQAGGTGSGDASGDAGGGDGTGGGAIARVGDLPVGGGKVLADRRIVLTRDGEGTVRAFSAVCTHTGCTVSGVSDGVIGCPCHGSTFRIADGSVVSGPAGRPLPSVAVTVDGDAIRLA